MYTVYKTINLENSEYYIGVHKTDNPNDRYYGSGLRIKRAIKKYGKKNFKKIILFCYDDVEQAFLNETKILDECLCDKKCLNLARGGKGGANFAGKKHSKETIDKIKLARSKQVFSDESIQKMAQTLTGRVISEETRKKLSELTHSDETKKKISESLKRYHKNKN